MGRLNQILRDTTVVLLLKYLGNFWRSVEMVLINYKIELKLKSIIYCVLAALGPDNTNENPNNIILLSKTQNYMILL